MQSQPVIRDTQHFYMPRTTKNFSLCFFQIVKEQGKSY